MQHMLVLSTLKADPFVDLDKDDDQLETNEVAKNRQLPTASSAKNTAAFN